MGRYKPKVQAAPEESKQEASKEAALPAEKVAVSQHGSSTLFRDSAGVVSSKRVSGFLAVVVGLLLCVVGALCGSEVAIKAASPALWYAVAALVGGTAAERMPQFGKK